jgi:uncharacterized membrane protein YphA (DoxX/SURF4 family)
MELLWKHRWLTLVLIIIRVALGCIFIYASWHKIVRPAEFAQAIANYQILPKVLINPAALLLPWVELVCGLGLISGFMVRGSTLIMGLLLIIFMAAMVASLIRGLDIHCGCFSSRNDATSNFYREILIDLSLIAMAVISFLFPGKLKQVDISSYMKSEADFGEKK